MSERKLIYADEIEKVAEHAYHEWNLSMAAAEGTRQINHIYKMQELCKAVAAVAKAAPAVDAVEVVRCKDCIHSRMYCFGGDDEPTLACCEIEEDDGYESVRVASSVEPDEYCSNGERRALT